MNMASARGLMPLNDRHDWNRPHLNYLPARLYRSNMLYRQLRKVFDPR